MEWQVSFGAGTVLYSTEQIGAVPEPTYSVQQLKIVILLKK